MCGACFGREALIGICCCPAASCRRQPAVWSIRIEKSRLKMPLTRSARFPVGCASITELAPDAETISHEYFSVEEMGLRNKRPVDDILSHHRAPSYHNIFPNIAFGTSILSSLPYLQVGQTGSNHHRHHAQGNQDHMRRHAPPFQQSDPVLPDEFKAPRMPVTIFKHIP